VCSMGVFFKRPHLLGSPQFPHFLPDLKYVKGLLVARLMPYQKPLNTKAIKCTITEPHATKSLVTDLSILQCLCFSWACLQRQGYYCVQIHYRVYSSLRDVGPLGNNRSIFFLYMRIVER